MGYFLQELKRRNVFRVGAAYVVVSWLILQVIETVSDPLGLPAWTEAFFIVLLAAGFPLALIFAWAFELTPDGLKKTREVDRDESVTADTGRKLNYAIITVLVLALGYSIWDRQNLVEAGPDAATAAGATVTAEGQTATASIAVLPFVNMSADPDQEYFSDGISEELLNLLAKIPGLRVPARTSSFQFKDRNLDISEVAKELNVNHVLEGSVRKADVKIRVTAQLIEADTGYHLWSETYDRELTDVFRIQDEISAAIVDALSDTLGISAAAAPKVHKAANPEAYNAYLLGQHLLELRTKGDIEAAIPNFETAIELDPDYAPAHAGLGLAWQLLLASRQTYGTLTLEESLSRARPHLDRALELNPELPEALGAMGLYLTNQQKLEEAVEYYERALQINPSQTATRNWYSMALADLGRVDDAYSEMKKAYEYDPVSVLTLNNYANEIVIRREFDKAMPIVNRLSQIDAARGAQFRYLMLDGQHRRGEGVIELFRGVDSQPGNLRVRASAAFALLNLGLLDEALAVWPYPNLLPIIGATEDRDYALELAQQQFENDPTDPGNVDALAWAYFRAGDVEQGLKNARRYLNAIEPSRRDIDGTNWMFVIEAWRRGDREQALTFAAPLEAEIDRSMRAGIDLPFPHFGKAVVQFMRGDIERSLESLDIVLSRNGVDASNIRDTFETLGWNDLPEYAERRQQFEVYVDAERRRFLEVACGAHGFSFWQPSPDTCSEVDTI